MRRYGLSLLILIIAVLLIASLFTTRRMKSDFQDIGGIASQAEGLKDTLNNKAAQIDDTGLEWTGD